MPRDPSFEPFRTFYREGGYVSAPEPEKPSRLQEIEMALWGSQNFADGGSVGDDGLPHFGGGGAQIMRKGFEPALQSVMEYLGGLKRNTIALPDTRASRIFEEKFPGTAQLPPAASWRTALRDGFFPNESVLPSHYSHVSDNIKDAANNYTTSDYSAFNDAYRKFAENTTKHQDHVTPYGTHWWETGNVHPWDDATQETLRSEGEMKIAKQARDLGRYLQDQEVELPYDIYRGARFRVRPDELFTGDAPELHGRGLGSFSFKPHIGNDFGTDVPSFHTPEYYSGSEQRIHKIPSTVRIPQGTKVRGANIAPFSQMDSEFEFLMAPFQGFDVTDVNLLQRPDLYNNNKGKPYNKLLLDAVPSNSYNPNSPAIYRDGGEVTPFPSMYDITGKYAAGGGVRDLMTGYAGQFYADGGPVRDLMTGYDGQFYADGGLASVFAPPEQHKPAPMMAEPIVPLPLLMSLMGGSANAATGNVSGTIGGPGVSSESAVGDAGATGGVGGSASSDAGVGGSAAAGVGGDDGGTYGDGGMIRRLARLMMPTARDAETTTGYAFKDVGHINRRMEPGDWREVSRQRDYGDYQDVELPISSMYASQSSVNPDFRSVANGESPFVIRKGGDYFLQDGHHRAMRAASEGNQTMPVRLVDLDGDRQTEFPLLDIMERLRGLK